jgi:Zn-dependent protease
MNTATASPADASGGEADEILMWPLGGLASCTPPHRWDAALWTTVGGPAVNAVLLVPLGLAVWLLTGETRAAVFNLFAPGAVWILLDSPGSTALHLLKITLWSFHYANALLLAFNVLIPMYPMDGGRIVHALLWRRLGHRDATRIAAIVGLVAAGVMAVFAIVFSELVLLALALFGGIICYTELQRLKFEQSADDAVFAASLAADDETDTKNAPGRSAPRNSGRKPRTSRPRSTASSRRSAPAEWTACPEKRKDARTRIGEEPARGLTRAGPVSAPRPPIQRTPPAAPPAPRRCRPRC